MPLFSAPVRADDEKCLRPEIQNMIQSVSEKVQAAADKLDLTADQRSKIREINASYAEKRKALRTERRALLQEELQAMGTVLSPEQREKVQDLVEDRVEEAKEARAAGLPIFDGERDTLAERLESAAEKIGLTGEQREQIKKALADHGERHAALTAAEGPRIYRGACRAGRCRQVRRRSRRGDCRQARPECRSARKD
jgi:Spy/CpxP family protein refolding chaperone